MRSNHCSQLFHATQLLHGFTQFHTHQRPDRDDHVTIQWENVMTSRRREFERCPGPPHCHTRDLKYDCDSVMHYAADQMSRNGKPTIGGTGIFNAH